ncbi:MAG: Phosphoribosylglycinamide formyltransferase [bacterium ADurb.BinA186]|nr:MAG: Phosphoribosylglycinamide formyltransferase [bacterium ADurb.BinA186]
MYNQDVINRIVRAIGIKNKPFKIGVMVSGQGGNLQALIDFSQTKAANFQVASVISNNPDGVALKRAQKALLPNHFINHRAFSNRKEFEQEIITFLDQEQVHLVVLAGFLRVLSPTFLNHFQDRIINLHPSLLPSFPGLHAIEQALAAGVSSSGCTVHIVDEGLDTGDIIGQHSCVIEPGEKIESLSAKIHQLEHALLAQVVNEIARQCLQKSSLKELHVSAENNPTHD